MLVTGPGLEGEGLDRGALATMERFAPGQVGGTFDSGSIADDEKRTDFWSDFQGTGQMHYGLLGS